jgi:hypothetical protein
LRVRGTHTHFKERKRGAWLREEEGELLRERLTSEQVWATRYKPYNSSRRVAILRAVHSWEKGPIFGLFL